MKKGRHRRYVEARELKHTNDEFDEWFGDNEQPCEECEALPGQDHKFWCLNRPADDAQAETEGDLFPS